MSIKSLIQILIFSIIIFILAFVYYKYFNTNKNIVEEINSLEISNQEQLQVLEKKILELETKNNELILEINNNKNIDYISSENEKKEVKKNDDIIINKKNTNLKTKTKNIVSSEEIKNLVKDVEYNSIDESGNNFYLLANSGKSNINNKDILDLVNVRGEITSDNRETIYIVSDFAQFNSINSNSKFYDNVKINYQDKQITCINFDINMETNKALAYNNVIITDPKSTMKAGLVEFDLKTKDININPETTIKEIEIITN
tara:strand:- start:5635 stop:6411 length:777 start_codon:yes stop_codon:yes gene_type:complete